MDRLEKYQEIIIEVLNDYARRFKKTSKNIKGIVVTDTLNHHFQFLWLGWDEDRHILSVTTHIDIIDNKVWVQHDTTEIGLANLLVEQGIPKSDIVLGYFSPEHRELTEFAVA